MTAATAGHTTAHHNGHHASLHATGHMVAASPTPSKQPKNTAKPAHKHSKFHIPTPSKKPSYKVMLAFLFASNLLASINQSMMNIALDSVSTTFHVELSVANWMVLIFAILGATTITTAASVLRRFGLRKVMMAGYVLSLIGSALGFFSWNFESMLVARMFQAFTLGLFFPIVSVAILDISPADKKATYLSLNSAIIGAGLAFIPMISGALITYVSLKAMFIVPLAISVVLLVAAPFVLYDIESRADVKLDIPSIALSFIGIFAFVYGLNNVSKDLIPAIAALAIGVATIGIFAWRQFHIENPLLNLEPLKHPSFAIGETVCLLGFSGSLYMSLLVPLFLEGTAQCTPSAAGAMLVGPIMAYAVSSFIGGKIEDRHGVWPLVPVGFFIMLCATIGISILSDQMNVIGVVILCAVNYFGVGLVFAPLKSRNLKAVPANLESHASSIHSTLVQVITSVASALFVGIMSSDITAALATGVTKPDAYAIGFSHTLYIEIGIIVVTFVVSIFFSRVMHKKAKDN